MNIQLHIDIDSDNSAPTGTLDLRRGVNRPANVVLVLDDRQIEVNMYELQRAVAALATDNERTN